MAIQILGADGNALTSRDVDGSASNFIYINGRLSFSGSYPTGGRHAGLDHSAGQSGGVAMRERLCIPQTLGNQYVPVGVPSTALNGWKVLCQQPGTFNTQLAAGAYPGGITSDTVTFVAVFRKLL